jgi:hypothetical protein
VADSALTQVNTPVILPTITINDTDTDGTVLSNGVDLDPLIAGQQNTFTVPGEGTFTDDGAGNITFTPDLAFTGTSTVAHTVSDNDGGLSAPANLSVRVNASPVANPDSAVTQLNTPVVLAAVTANDTDSDGTVVASSVDLDPLIAGQQNTFTVPGGPSPMTAPETSRLHQLPPSLTHLPLSTPSATTMGGHRPQWR